METLIGVGDAGERDTPTGATLADWRLHELSAAEVAEMQYTDLVALMRETNRPPGGKRAVAELARLIALRSDHGVLEIGSTTGFTSLELAKLTGCRVDGIDVSEKSVAEAERRRALEPATIRDRVSFAVGDATAIDAADGTYDVVVCGGANSFIDEARRPKALAEYRRVLKPYGFLSITNLFYAVEPPLDLVKRVSATIGTSLRPRGLEDWLEIYVDSSWELFELRTWRMTSRSDSVLRQYIDSLFAQPHLAALAPDTLDALHARWTSAMEVFNENHRYLGTLMLVLRAEQVDLPEQPELFLLEESYDRFFERAIVGRTPDD